MTQPPQEGFEELLEAMRYGSEMVVLAPHHENKLSLPIGSSFLYLGGVRDGHGANQPETGMLTSLLTLLFHSQPRSARRLSRSAEPSGLLVNRSRRFSTSSTPTTSTFRSTVTSSTASKNSTMLGMISRNRPSSINPSSFFARRSKLRRPIEGRSRRKDERTCACVFTLLSDFAFSSSPCLMKRNGSFCRREHPPLSTLLLRHSAGLPREGYTQNRRPSKWYKVSPSLKLPTTCPQPSFQDRRRESATPPVWQLVTSLEAEPCRSCRLQGLRPEPGA